MSDTEDGNPEEVFDVDRIRRLVKLMEQHDLHEIDLRQADQRIRLCRGGQPLTLSTPLAMAPGHPPAGPATPAAPSEEASASSVVSPTQVTIKSPMVGTFYSRANPNSEPFVRVGDAVDAETTVCIIEAMKVFNEIPAEVRGRIVAVLVDDEEPVEFGKPLFHVDTGSDEV